MKICLTGLSEGVHCFDQQETPSDLGLAGKPGFENPIAVHAEVEKLGSMIVVEVEIETTAIMCCDRCAEDFEILLGDQFRLVFGNDPSYRDSEDEVLRWVAENSHEIDLAPDIRDIALLARPFKALCSDECKGLCPRCGANLNFVECDCEFDRIDPRWEALRRLA